MIVSLGSIFKKIMNEYKERGNEFLLHVFGSSKYLEDLSGITELLTAQHDEVKFIAFLFRERYIIDLFRFFLDLGIQWFRLRIFWLNC